MKLSNLNSEIRPSMNMIATLSLLVGFTVGASSVKADPAKNSPDCVKVVAACEAPEAGFKPGAHKTTGMGLWIDCVRKLAKGETVQGVSGVTKEEAAKCLAEKKEIRKAKKAAAAGGH